MTMKLEIDFKNRPDSEPVGIPIQTQDPGRGLNGPGVLAGAQPVAGDDSWMRHYPGHGGRRGMRRQVEGLLLRVKQPMWQPARVHPAGSR